jgi:triacylglycerol lipase|tara:strand:- start:66 stop:902 length:837 start_codon:yes stop_codon:yes gene_type:complete
MNELDKEVLRAMSHQPKKGELMSISEMDLKQRSLLFARLASDAYAAQSVVREVVVEHGFKDIEFYEKEGAQAYRFENETDVVIACRGTQPTEFNDLKADLKALPAISETVSRVHRGFKDEVDELWPEVKKDLKTDKKVWFCGHSLGAAMATIMAARCTQDSELGTPTQLYTYGSPRVGWPQYVKSLKVDHIRWQNNNDIVTRVPPRLLHYRHHGKLHYIGSTGDINVTGTSNAFKRFLDRLNGMWLGLKKGQVDNFSDHAMVGYIEHLSRWNGFYKKL